MEREIPRGERDGLQDEDDERTDLLFGLGREHEQARVPDPVGAEEPSGVLDGIDEVYVRVEYVSELVTERGLGENDLLIVLGVAFIAIIAFLIYMRFTKKYEEKGGEEYE